MADDNTNNPVEATENAQDSSKLEFYTVDRVFIVQKLRMDQTGTIEKLNETPFMYPDLRAAEQMADHLNKEIGYFEKLEKWMSYGKQ